MPQALPLPTQAKATEPASPAGSRGLTREEAAARLRAAGFNELPSARPRSLARAALALFAEPIFLLLLTCAGLYLVMGSHGEAVLLFASVALIAWITIFQERRTERALYALRELSSPRALVIRDGVPTRIPGREVVPGDCLVVREGDRVPADAELLEASHLAIDESLLTGESFPVPKGAGQGFEKARVFSGTLAVRGQGLARVVATGARTELGRIGRMLSETRAEPTGLQNELAATVRKFAILAILVCALITTVYGLTRGAWLQALLAGLATAMTVLPEEFPVVLTVFLAMGAWRLSKRNVLARRLAAIENLGTATMLCVDKTGTLTQNRMSVAALAIPQGVLELREAMVLPEAFHPLIEYGVLASHRDPFDPMEIAITSTLESRLSHTEHQHPDWRLVREYPLSDELLAMSCVWEEPRGGGRVIAAKGAPEAVLDLCHADESARRAVLEQVRALASRGTRVLGVARAHIGRADLPTSQHDFDFEWIGLIGLEDPVRPEAAEALGQCYRAGLRVLMITGDYPETARSVAVKLGLRETGVLTGAELAKASDDELARRLRTTGICARVVPEQKLRVVKALQRAGEIVAMTGDGVNDAPALKAADIGIAMGGRGTDVAREAADLVLLDDNFVSIVGAIRQGRRIYDNIQRAMAYLVAIHVSIAGLALAPVLSLLPLILVPATIVFIELVVDPTCSLYFEAEGEADDVMARPPRRRGERLFTRALFSSSLLNGGLVFLAAFGAFLVAPWLGMPVDEARALAFATLIFGNLGLVLATRPRGHRLREAFANPALRWIYSSALALLALVLYLPGARPLFGFGVLSLLDLAVVIALGLGVVALVTRRAF